MPGSPVKKSRTKSQGTARTRARPKAKPKAKTGSQPGAARPSRKPAQPAAPKVVPRPAARVPLSVPGTEPGERSAELALINSIQEGVAAKLDFKAIVDLVGDKLREVFSAPDLGITWYDEKTGLLHYLYCYEHGKRIDIAPRAPMPGGMFERHRRTRKPLVANTPADYARVGAGTPLPGTDQGKSYVSVPIISSDKVLGEIGIENFERENAFGKSEVRLLTTIAASLGTALDNARLFDETQRLFKAEQQRAAELVVINSIQQGMAENLDFQAIVNHVGDKLREVFHTGDIGVRWYEEKTGLMHYLYQYEHGKRQTVKPRSPLKGGPWSKVEKTRQPLVMNREEYAALGVKPIPGTDQSQCVAYIPIMGSDRVLGLIVVENYERRDAFGEAEVRLLSTVAASMGVALENARLFDETQRLFKAEQQRAAELAVINSIQQGMAQKLDFQAIIDLVGDKLREVFGMGDMGISWYNEKTRLLHYLYNYEHGKRLNIEPQRPSPGGMFETMIKDRRPWIFNTAADYERAGQSPIAGTDQSKSLIAVPIVSGDRVLGLINLENYERENAYGEAELRLLTTIAASLGTALENARLFDETQHLLKVTAQRAAELEVINSIQRGITEKLDFQAIIDMVGDKLREVFHTGDIGVRWYDHDTGLMHYLYAYEHGKKLVIAPRPPMKGGPWEKMVATRQPIVLNTRAEGRAIGANAIPGTDDSLSAMYAPILGSDRVLGTIVVESFEREDAYGEAEVRLLSTVAASMGVALENARLFDATQHLLKETEQRNAELAIINSVQAALAAELNIQGIYDA